MCHVGVCCGVIKANLIPEVLFQLLPGGYSHFSHCQLSSNYHLVPFICFQVSLFDLPAQSTNGQMLCFTAPEHKQSQNCKRIKPTWGRNVRIKDHKHANTTQKVQRQAKKRGGDYQVNTSYRHRGGYFSALHNSNRVLLCLWPSHVRTVAVGEVSCCRPLVF